MKTVSRIVGTTAFWEGFWPWARLPVECPVPAVASRDSRLIVWPEGVRRALDLETAQ